MPCDRWRQVTPKGQRHRHDLKISRPFATYRVAYSWSFKGNHVFWLQRFMSPNGWRCKGYVVADQIGCKKPYFRGVVTALKPVRAEQVRRPEPPVALGVRGYYLLPGKLLKSLEILNVISCDLVHNILCCKCRYNENLYYRAIHFSAKRGLAIACRPPVRPSVCLSVCDVGGLWSHRLKILETNWTDN